MGWDAMTTTDDENMNSGLEMNRRGLNFGR